MKECQNWLLKGLLFVKSVQDVISFWKIMVMITVTKRSSINKTNHASNSLTLTFIKLHKFVKIVFQIYAPCFLCVGHQVNLVCQDACTEFSVVSHMINIVNKIAAFVKESPKHCAWFAAIQAYTAELLLATVKLQPLCSSMKIALMHS